MARKTVRSVANTFALIVLSLSLLGAIGFPGRHTRGAPFRPLEAGPAPAWKLPSGLTSSVLPAAPAAPVVPVAVAGAPALAAPAPEPPPEPAFTSAGIVSSSPRLPDRLPSGPGGEPPPAPMAGEALTRTFQQGDANAYSGTVDTYDDVALPAADNSAAALLTADGPAGAADERQVLIRFDNIFGSGPTQIPPGSTITSATLTVNVSNAYATTDYVRFNRMKQAWSATNSWSTFGSSPWNATGGIQADDLEAVAAADITTNNISTGSQSIAVTTSLQAWSADPASNFGWVIRSGAADSLAFDSSEVATVANRPKLSVTFNPACQSAADCNDNIACTTDTCNTGTGVCSNIDSCTGGQTCNPASGVCGVQAIFRDGTGTYSGTQDTEIEQANPTTGYGSVADWRWDTETGTSGSASLAFGLVRFDGLFGSNAGQIPPGSTVQSATLTLVSFNSTSGTAASINEVAVDWQESSVTWDTFGGDAGIQSDEYRTSPAYSAPLFTGAAEGPPIVTVTAGIDVTQSLQNWSNNPALNFGWVFRPNSTDGCRVYSAEQTTVAQRPLLTVWYVPVVTSCATDPECSNGLYCDGVETCPAGTCVAGIAPSCADAFSCTTDSCNEGTDSCDHSPNNVACNDSNVCTDDSCDPASGDPVTGCVHLNNSATCTDGNACTDPDGCQGGNCISGPAVTCNDNVACTTDSCVAPTGCQYADGCTGGQVCNHTTGMCETPTVPPLPINLGETWKYFKGTTEPPSTWKNTTFDDGAWLSGASGIGYGNAGSDCEAQRGTTLTDMLNSYPSVYMRRQFYVADPGAIYGLDLTVYYDDAFVAYLNGQEVARSVTPSSPNITGNPPAYDTVPSPDHECTGPETFTIDKTKLVSGVNVIAIQGHNGGTASSDFIVAPKLEATSPPNQAPSQPSSPSPSNNATAVSLTPDLCVTVSDPEAQAMGVSFFGRVATGAAPQDFTLVVLPDPQVTTMSYPDLLRSQFQWAADNRATRNIVFFTDVGDTTNNGDEAGQEGQWVNANSAFVLLENPATTGLPDGIPFGLALGNHDNGGSARSGTDEGATTIQYTKYFGLQRFCPGTCAVGGAACTKDADCTSGICNPGSTCRSYYGGRYDFGAPSTYPRNMDNHYELFTASGMTFAVFHLELDGMGSGYSATCPVGGTCRAAIQWMHGVLAAHPAWRAIVVSHSLIVPSGAAMSEHGQAVLDGIKDLPNVFLTLSGHLDQANRRTDLANDGHNIYQLVQDYQSRSYGGRGWMRRFIFSPQNDTIDVETFSPWVNYPSTPKTESLIDSHGDNTAGTAQNHFTLTYDMDAGLPFTQIGSTQTGVASGTQVCMSWPGRAMNTTYEWYATASDGNSSAASPYWRFTTATTCDEDADCSDLLWCNGAETCNLGTSTCVAGTPPDCGDAIACTADGCNEATDSCDHVPNHAMCADSLECTDDSCDLLAGCVNTPDDTNACSDGNACTAPDSCVAGSCVSGPAVTCNDGVACTDDACVPATGCEYTGNCSVGWRCNLATGACEEGCAADPDCDDGDACTTDTCDLPNAAALDFDGGNDYVTMGAAAGETALGARAFTLEAWIKRDGATWGATTSTGSGGVTAVPLVTKGRGESDTGNLNCNYFLGITAAGVPVADFEQHGAAGGWADGQNHPACGTGTITDQNWHHVAVTYSTTDGWRIYLDGVEGTAADGTGCTTCSPAGSCPRSPGVLPEYDSIQHFGLGTAMNSSGTPEGYFAGMMDEARVWNLALAQSDIQANMHSALIAGTGLVGRWGLEEGNGTAAADSTTPAQNGTLTNGPLWIATDLPALGDGTCAHTTVPGCCNTDLECDDSVPCTTDSCNLVSHTCVNAPPIGFCCVAADCADANPCTDDACVDTVCVNTNNTASCNDGNACTTADVCSNGTCAGTTVSCDDGNVCTDDSCVPATGCAHANNAAACDDTNACTTADACSGGACDGEYVPWPGCCSTNAHCDDGNGGTADVCTAGTCSNTPTCTTNEQCADADVCTTDTCTASGGAAIELDGTNDYVNLGNDGNTAAVNYLTNFGTGSFTIEGWFRADTATTYMGLFRQGSQNAYPQVVVQFPGTSPYNRIAGSIETSTGGTQVDATVATQFTVGQWYHYAMVADRTPGAQALTVYLHDATGALVGSAQAAASAWSTYPINDTYTGTSPNEVRDPALMGVARTPSPGANYNYYFDGRLDEMRIWDHARTAQQILDNVKLQIPSATGLVHRWAMSEGTGTTMADTGAAPTTVANLVNGPTWRTLTADLPPFAEGTCEYTPVPGCCNTNDECADADPCTIDTCNPVSHTCGNVPAGECCVDADCNDSNVCTDDTCDTGTNACGHTFNTDPCNDGNPGTGNDVCAGGVCAGSDLCAGVTCTALDQCHVPGVCDPQTGICTPSPAAPDGTGCSDGNACTATDMCQSGACAPGAPLDCSDSDDCTTDSCDPASGCRNTPLNCFDGDSCTLDSCAAGVCQHQAIDCENEIAGPFDGTFLTTEAGGGATPEDPMATTVTSPVSGTIEIHETVAAGNAPSGVTFIDLQVEVTAPPASSAAPLHLTFRLDASSLPTGLLIDGLAVYRDGVAVPNCTGAPGVADPDPCVSSRAFLPDGDAQVDVLTSTASAWNFGYTDCGSLADGTPCDDENACTQTDTCQAGVCTGENPVVCTALNPCHDVGTCDTVTGVCSDPPKTDGTLCDDGDACTQEDTCQAGACASGTPVSCDDFRPCTDDTCDPLGGCIHTPDDTNSCSDGNLCNGLETCSGGDCAPGTPLTCSDGNPCTDDTCDPVSGCVYTPDDTNSCDDGTICTIGDACLGGLCVGSPTCNDGNVCTSDVCTGTNVNGYALNFDGADDHVTMGQAAGESALGARAFTLEAWVKRDGASWGNANASTGTGGLQNVVALITKGRSEADGTTQDCNYFFGITAGGRLVADFEQYAASGTGGTVPAGQNRPICSTSTGGAIADQNWHHVAVTYSTAAGWKLYLDGADVTAANGLPATCGTESTCSDGSICVQSPGVEPRYDSIQHFGLGVALNSTGASPGGYFGGMMDEPRVWNYARSAAEIRTGMSMQIQAAAGLIGHWGLNEGSGTTANDSTTPAQNGTLTGGPAWASAAEPALGQCEYVAIANCCVTAAECNDGNVCTDDACTGNQCEHANNAASCTDGNSCTSEDVCSGGTCTGTPIPDCCQGDAQCDDGNGCTTDSCNTGNAAAIELNGTTQYVNLGNDGNTANVNFLTNYGTNSFTIEGWFWADASNTDRIGIFRQGSQGSYPQVVVQLMSSNRIAASVEASTTGTQVDTATPPTFTLGAWHHFAMVVVRDLVTPANQRLNLYLDGVLKESTLASLWGTYPINDSSLSGTYDSVILGAARTAPGANYGLYLDGRLDEFRIWDHARDATQIAANMNKQILSAPGLRHRWAMNEGAGTTAADSGSTPTTAATLVNAPIWRAVPGDIPAFGNDRCQHANNTLPCEDGSYCTVNDACGGGACTGGAQRDCSDSVACTTDACDEGADSCTHTASNAACDDGLWCNGAETCDLVGGCQAGTEPSCDDGVACTTDACDEGTDSCTHVASNAACDDGLFCTDDVCDPVQGCQHSARSCDDGVACTTDACDEGSDSCTHTASNAACDDGLFCTDDVCDPVQGCQHPAHGCADGVACTTDACDEGTDSCTHAASNAACDDGLWCNGAETCDPVGGCQPGTPPSCDDGVACTTDACDEGADSCTHAASNAACDDGLFCTEDACDPVQGCQHSARGCDDGVACTTDACDEETDSCTHAASNAACDDGLFCTDDVCDPVQGCQHPAHSCADGVACTTDACDEGTDSCTHAASNAACDDGLWCNGAETCDPVGGCQSGTPPSCDDGVACTNDACDEVADSCAHAPSDAACGDGNACTTDTCDPLLGCRHTAVTCDDGSACTSDSCDPLLGCVFIANPTVCDDGRACTSDTCAGPFGNFALSFNGTNQSLDFGAAADHPELGLSQFTLEAWIYRSTGGTTASSGTGGVVGYPIIAKGVGEGDNSNVDANYFFAIDSATGKLGADFEEGVGQASPGLNHPILGNTVVPLNEWHHVAVTYDGTTWALYLDGNVDGTLVVGRLPRSDSIQRFAVATTTNSTGADAGFFSGQIDEVRVWNVARSALDISTSRNRRITAAQGLVGRWGLDEGAGGAVGDSTGANNGTLVNAPTWVSGASGLGTATCSYANASSGTVCDDGNACTTGDQCSAGTCGGTSVPGCCLTAADCVDVDTCTADACVDSQCIHTPIPDCCQSSAQCDDGNVCTTESCNTANDAAIKLNGTSQYVNLGNDGATTAVNYLTNFGSGSFTIEGWFAFDNPSTPALYAAIFRQGRQGTNPQVVVQYNGGFAVSVETDTGNQKDIATALTFPDSAWHHFAMVVNRTTNQLELWLDGVKKNNVDTSVWGASTISNKYTADAVWLGVARDSAGAIVSGSYLNGKVDELRTWDYAWTATDFGSYMGRELTSAPGLRHRWAMNEGSGTTTADSGSTPTGAATLVGTPTWLTSSASIPAYGNDRCLRANNTLSCEDGAYCTIGDVCDGGFCVGGTQRNCSDGVVCTADACDEGADSCTHVATNAACEDGSVCNGLETCDPVAGCQPGTPLTCDDGLWCNGTETCDPITGCQPGTAPNCNDNVDCTSDACDEAADSCTHAASNAACDDANVCNGLETCDPVAGCQPGTPLTCDDGNVCNGLETCDPVNGCQPGTPLTCDDGLWCNGTETCDPITGCQPGTAPNCNDGVACTTDACDEAIDSCTHEPSNAACDDANVCNGPRDLRPG